MITEGNRVLTRAAAAAAAKQAQSTTSNTETTEAVDNAHDQVRVDR